MLVLLLMRLAVNAIAGFCQGNPRLIDNLMTDALTLGSQLKKQSIDAEVILAASITNHYDRFCSD